MKRFTKTLLAFFAGIVLLTSLSAQAALIVTTSNNGTTAPSLGANDTGYTGAANQRFGWDNGESLGQTFTLANPGIIDSIFIGYNAFDSSDSITLELSVNNVVVASGIVLNGSNFSGLPSDNNSAPVYWMQFQFSGDPVAVNAGTNNFSFTATAETELGGSAFIFAPMRNTNNLYAGGQITGTATNGDALFAVTVAAVPEPGSLSLLGLGGLGLIVFFRRIKR